MRSYPTHSQQKDRTAARMDRPFMAVKYPFCIRAGILANLSSGVIFAAEKGLYGTAKARNPRQGLLRRGGGWGVEPLPGRGPGLA